LQFNSYLDLGQESNDNTEAYNLLKSLEKTLFFNQED